MSIVDLTYLIEPEMSLFPGVPKPVLTPAMTCEKDGCKVSILETFSHVGTHVDAPGHMLPEGKNLDDLEVSNFCGKMIILDARSMTQIGKRDIEKLPLADIDFVVLYTGWQDKWGSEQYIHGYPLLTEEAAEFLAQADIKGVGMDTISIDAVDDSDFKNHKIVMSGGKIIVENLTNLDKVGDGIHEAVFLPLKVKGFEGCPVRACAFL